MNEPDIKTDRQQDDEIRRYWLGQLSLDATAQLEERYFAADDLFVRVQVVKEELIDDYLFKRLDAEARRRFDSHFLKASEHREHVEAIQALIEKLKATPQPAPLPATAQHPRPEAEKTTFGKLWGDLPAGFKVLAWTGAALVLFAVIGTVTLYRENRQMRQELDQILSEKLIREAELARVTAELKRKEAALLAFSPSPSPSITPQPQPGVTPKMSPPVTDQSALVAFATLSPDMGGRGSSYSTEVKIATDDQRLKLTLKVNDATAYRRYGVEVKTDGGQPVRSRSGLRPASSDSIEITLPARLLATGKYDLTLYGESSKNATVPLFSYSFRVVRD